MSDSKREIFTAKIAELFKNEPSFKNFHGFVQFNISFGDCKNHYIEVTTRKTFIDGKKNA
jgi:hypothetical protein